MNSGIRINSSYNHNLFQNKTKQNLSFGSATSTLGKGIIGSIKNNCTDFIYNEKGTIQKVAGASAFAAIWSNAILGSFNMFVRPAVFLAGNKDKNKEVQTGKLENQSEDEKKQRQARLYVAGRLFLQEAFGLVATGIFVLTPIRERLGLFLGKIMTKGNAEAQEAFGKYTVKHLKELEQKAKGGKKIAEQAVNFAKKELDNLPSVIKGAKGLGDAIAIITALSIIGPILNNMLVKPMLVVASVPLRKMGIEVEIPETTEKK